MSDRKILLVDDDENYAESMADLLEGEGLGEILLAKNGKEALVVLRELTELPCMILLDLAMPEMSGRELLAAMDGELKKIPVVVCSGRKPEAELPEQVVAQLCKPIDLEKLLQICSQVALRHEA